MTQSNSNLRRWMNRALVIYLSVTIYILSVGPAVVFNDKSETGGRFIEVFYAPVIWLHDRTPLREPLDRYVEFCQRVGDDLTRPRPLFETVPDDFTDVPNEITICGKQVYFDTASVTRNFMPECPPDGFPSHAFLRVTTKDKTYFPAGVRFEKVWVIDGNKAWIPQLEEPIAVTKKDDGPCLIARGGRGPMWEPGLRVDVVIRLRDEDGKAYLLRIKNAEVQRIS